MHLLVRLARWHVREGKPGGLGWLWPLRLVVPTRCAILGLEAHNYHRADAISRSHASHLGHELAQPIAVSLVHTSRCGAKHAGLG